VCTVPRRTVSSRSPRVVSDETGYSLIEVIVALVILAIVASTAVPSFAASLSLGRGRSAAAQLTSDIAFTRTLAIRSGRGATLAFTGTSGYAILEGSGAGAVARKFVDLSVDHPGLQIVRVTAGTNVVFDSRGMATAGSGKLAVRPAGVAAGQPADTIRISPVGMVRRDR
jgi:type IV fimbrial biogenesis protein FimT